MSGGFDLFGDKSTLDNGARDDFDFYETATWMTRSLLHFHRAIQGTRVLECASGRNAIARVLRDEAGCYVVTNDIDPRHPAQLHYDARDPVFWQRVTLDYGVFDYVVTNLPFRVAIEILPHAIAHAHFGVATILLKSFDEPTEDRGEFLSRHPWTRKINLPRHKFRGTGSPSMASDWFIWERNRNRALDPCVVDHIAKSRTRRMA